ncbi:MAG: MerR family transcriptional regulator, partial [Planctomycetaceae bacterium]
MTALAAAALADANYNGQASGRVRDVPDKRTIRYYTTLGLLDRPAEMRGRTAWYGRRHVLQLAAIKRLQAQGLSLLDVQQRLAGTDDQTLTGIAQLPGGFWERVETDELSTTSAPDRTTPRPRFWAAAPELPQTTEAAVATIRPALQLRLAPGVTLVLD